MVAAAVGKPGGSYCDASSFFVQRHQSQCLLFRCFFFLISVLFCSPLFLCSSYFFFLSICPLFFSFSPLFFSVLSSLSIFVLFFFYPSLILPPGIVLFPHIYKWKTGKRGLLPLSSHDTGVRWSGGHWAAISRLLEGLSSLFFHLVLGHGSEFRQMGGFIGFFWVLGEREIERERNRWRGTYAFSFPASRIQGKKKTHSVVQNDTILGFFSFFFLFFNSGWNNVLFPKTRCFI